MRLGGVLVAEAAEGVPELVHRGAQALAPDGGDAAPTRAEHAVADEDHGLPIVLGQLAHHVEHRLGVDAHMARVGAQRAAVEGGVVVPPEAIDTVVRAHEVRAQPVEVGRVGPEGAVALEEVRDIRGQPHEPVHLVDLVPLPHQNDIDAVLGVAALRDPVPAEEGAGLTPPGRDLAGLGRRELLRQPLVVHLGRAELALARHGLRLLEVRLGHDLRVVGASLKARHCAIEGLARSGANQARNKEESGSPGERAPGTRGSIHGGTVRTSPHGIREHWVGSWSQSPNAGAWASPPLRV